MSALPRHADIVIVGGGAIGCSIAYHLARLGHREVILLEKAGLTQGCTWHAAGLVGQLRNQRNLTRLMQDSVALYREIEADTGQAVDWHEVGSLRLASTPGRWQEMKRLATTARNFGVELHLVDAAEAQGLFPPLVTDGVLGAAWIPSDGYVDPSSLTQAYARGARKRGVRIFEGVTVTGVIRDGRRMRAVNTDQGEIRCEVLVNAAGLWAREFGALCGVPIPAGVVEHQYLVTEKVQGLPANLPTLRDPDRLFYLKPEVGGFAVGGWEPDTVPCRLPGDFARQLFNANFDRFEQILIPTAERIPLFNTLGVRTLINGPIPVSWDGEPIMGLAPDTDNLFVACGFTAGIAASGGAGLAMARWIAEGDPGMDLWPLDIRRFAPHCADRPLLEARAVESYGRYYTFHPPWDEAHSARPLRTSPLHGRLAAAGAVFGSRAGWERPNWFGEAAAPAADYRWPAAMRQVAAEHCAVRERVALIDQSSFAKFELRGPHALERLQWLCAADVDKPVGRIVYTQMCNTRGGIECDLTVVRLAEDRFYLITGSGFRVHDGDWIRRHLPHDGATVLTEVTSAFAVINLCGPRSREVLQAVTDADVSSTAFPFACARVLPLRGAAVRALRIGYVGELGWELHVPTEFAAAVYDALWAAGQAYGMANAGYKAIDSLRLEKGYLYWSADIGPETDPFAAGLGSRVALDKGAFCGREALELIHRRGPERRLAILTLDVDVPVYGGEAVIVDDAVVGTVTSAGFGHTVGAPVLFAYLPVAAMARQAFVIEAFGERHPARRHDRVLYDPDNRRLRG